MPKLAVHFLPERVYPADLAGSVVVVIDLLRASTTICKALAAGAECIMPFVEVEDAERKAEELGRDNVVMGGERGGVLIPGFDLGNSPAEYRPETVDGKRLLFTTTNGAKALHHARLARKTVIGSAINRLAVARHVIREQQIDILCAGTDGKATLEDVLAAGALASVVLDLTPAGGPKGETCQANEGALEALGQWNALMEEARQESRTISRHFALELRDTPGGRNLIDVGLEQDIDYCAELDTVDVVPVLDRATNEIRSA